MHPTKPVSFLTYYTLVEFYSNCSNFNIPLRGTKHRNAMDKPRDKHLQLRILRWPGNSRNAITILFQLIGVSLVGDIINANLFRCGCHFCWVFLPTTQTSLPHTDEPGATTHYIGCALATITRCIKTPSYWASYTIDSQKLRLFRPEINVHFCIQAHKTQHSWENANTAAILKKIVVRSVSCRWVFVWRGEADIWIYERFA